MNKTTQSVDAKVDDSRTTESKCDMILFIMQMGGFEVPRDCSTWTDEEKDHFLVNYETFYLS